MSKGIAKNGVNKGWFKKGSIPWNLDKKITSNTGRTHFKKGLIPWNKNKKWTKEMKDKVSGENSTNWKGDNVKYVALHVWVRKNIKKSSVCQICGKRKKLDLANKTGIYNRIFINWFFLCRSCHIKYDRYRKKD